MQQSKTKILFVCLGNICRSPLAETIMNDLLEKRGLQDFYSVDSAGIIDYHEGERADYRMRCHASFRGYDITHLSRPVQKVKFGGQTGYSSEKMARNELSDLIRVLVSIRLDG